MPITRSQTGRTRPMEHREEASGSAPVQNPDGGPAMVDTGVGLNRPIPSPGQPGGGSMLCHHQPPASPSEATTGVQIREPTPMTTVTLQGSQQPIIETTRKKTQASSTASRRARRAELDKEILEVRLKLLMAKRAEIEAADSEGDNASNSDVFEEDPSRVEDWLEQQNKPADKSVSALVQQIDDAINPQGHTSVQRASMPPNSSAYPPLGHAAHRPTEAPSGHLPSRQSVLVSARLGESYGLEGLESTGEKVINSVQFNKAQVGKNNSECPRNKSLIDVSELATAIAAAARAVQPSQPLPRYLGELPYFNGAHYEWLSFQAAFKETEAYYTMVENTARLRRSLKGKAKEAVNCLLIANSKPAEIMKTLETRFGRPDSIALSELEKLRNINKPSDSPRDICLFSSKIKNCVATLKVLQRKQYLYNPEIVKAITEKLTPTLRYRWFDYVANRHDDEPDLILFEQFIEKEADICGRFAPPEQIPTFTEKQPTNKQPEIKKARFHRTFKTEERQPEVSCGVCSRPDHDTGKCKEFIEMDIDKRWNTAKELNLCYRCLNHRKGYHKCQSRKCGVGNCTRTHHKMLHRGKMHREPPTKEVETVASARSSLQSYLKIIPVTITGSRGKVESYALLDDGSTTTLIDGKIAAKIGARGPIDPLRIESIGGKEIVNNASKRVTITLQGQGKRHRIQARTIVNLHIASQSINREDTEHSHLQDIKHHFVLENAKPTILIGQDNWHLLLSTDTRTGKSKNAPVASLTPLGWVLHGYSTRTLGRRVHYVSHVKTENELMEENIETQMKKFFTIDQLNVQPRAHQKDPDEQAIRILKENTRERPTGGYETALLWKTDVQLPNNYEGALKRLHSIEKRLDKDPQLKEKYSKQVEELLTKDYAEEAPAQATPGHTWYLPHFPVLSHSKPGKVRMVMDAAAQYRGTALNDHLLTGPDLLQLLPGVIMRFRQHKVAVAADIQEMFLRIGILEQDRNCLRFLWRGDRREGPPKVYRMKSVIFGAACSPCTALYIKNYNAQRHCEQFPIAAGAIEKNHYMDDYLQSFHTEEEAIEIASQVKAIHAKATFNLTKFTSNRPHIVHQIDSATVEASTNVELHDEESPQKILGLTWKPATDELAYNLNFSRIPSDIMNGLRTPTKREALKAMMSLFDPLGLAAPLTVQAKKILQETWRFGVGWDDQLPKETSTAWHKWIQDLEKLRQISLPRSHSGYSYARLRQLHTFVDASETAYAAAVYWRVVDEEGKIHISLAAAKARVAPLKLTSIPRLELQAAVLGCRLARTVAEEYDHKPDDKYFWSDSKTVLSWLRAGPRTFKAFVAHRIAEIEEETSLNDWRWVPTKENVADVATRDTPEDFSAQHKWFKGPDFLYKSEEYWPKEKVDTTEPTIERIHLTRNIDGIKLKEALPPVERFSSWLRLLRCTARVLHFTDVLRPYKSTVCYKRTTKKPESDPTWQQHSKKIEKKQSTLLPHRDQPELSLIQLPGECMKRAEALWVKSSQQEAFQQEIEDLREQKPISKESRLRLLAVILDADGTLRVKSRIEATRDITREQSEPAILDGKHAYTRLYVAWIHKRLMHGGVETTVNEIRQHYWILHLRPTVKMVVKSCLQCRIRKVKPSAPPTGNHPPTRLAHHVRPFTYTGMDYFGPLTVTVGRRHEKRYVALFTCLTTRAVHLEIAASLTSDSAILALRRMIARRGQPKEVHSDNGTNMHGADNELRKALQHEASSRGIVWRYTCPAAPFMAGVWERLVKTVKAALYSVLKEKSPREEVLSTLLCEAEYTVNSRPLTHVSVNPDEPEALTPNHFLLGGSGLVSAPGSFTDSDLTSQHQWRQAQRLADIFWERWMREYLPELQHRREPHGHGEPVKIDDVVIIADESLPRNTWPRGKVIATYPGRDGVVRIVDVQTRGGVLRRPTKKLAVLPTETQHARRDIVAPTKRTTEL